MSENETTEMWREHRQHVQKQRWNSIAAAIPVLRTSGIPGKFRNMDTVFIVRSQGWPRVDFWPSSGMWRDVDTKKKYFGDEKSFIVWCSATMLRSTKTAGRS